MSHWPRRRNAEVGHQHRQRDAHDRLVEDHDERGDQQDGDDRAVTRGHRPRGGARFSRLQVGALAHESSSSSSGANPAYE